MASKNNVIDREQYITDTYEDPTPRKVLTKKDLNHMAVRSFFLQASFNYERMQGGGWVYGLIPGLKKIHKNKKDLRSALLDHLQFFNTHPFLVTFIQGVILAMEENKEPRSTIRGFKVALMGPLGGIGDALFWLTLLPVTAGIASSLAQEGNILGPLFFIVVFNIVHLLLRFGLIHYGYNTGTRAIEVLKQYTKKISRAVSIVGLSVIGALTATYINLSIAATVTAGEIEVAIQEDVLDQVMPKLLPLAYVFFCYWMLKKGRSPITLILITLVIGVLGVVLGIL